jgi:hypothetical protein
MALDRPVDLIEASLLLYDHESGRQLHPLSRGEVRELREGGRFYYCIAQHTNKDTRVVVPGVSSGA